MRFEVVAKSLIILTLVSASPGAAEDQRSGCPLQAIRELIQKQDPRSLAEAETKLQECTSEDRDGEAHLLLGLAQLLQQKYAAAKESLASAVAANPQNAEWSTLHDRAARNVASKIGDGLTNDQKFDDAALAQPAATYIREPKDIKPMPERGAARPPPRVPALIGGLGTKVLGAVVERADRKGPAANWQEWPKLKDGDVRAAGWFDYAWRMR